jgi:hypothetical protein
MEGSTCVATTDGEKSSGELDGSKRNSPGLEALTGEVK